MAIRAALAALLFAAQLALCAGLGLGAEPGARLATAAPPCHGAGDADRPAPPARDEGCAAHCASLFHALAAAPPTATPPSSPALAPPPDPLRRVADLALGAGRAEERAPPGARKRLAHLAVLRC